jgi:hypothetical protein
MKTQISRWSDEPRKRRSGLYQQQGRMISDADWNELMELLKRRVDEALGEVVGSGAPRLDNTGLLANGPAGGVPVVKRANLYVDGIRATLDSSVAGTAPFPITQQADFPGAPAFTAADQMIYVDVWELATTAVEDGTLLDPGLHGADTTTRTQTLAQIKWCAAAVNPLTDPRNPSRGDAICKLELREGSNAADPCDACAAEVAIEQRIGNYLFRLEVHELIGTADAPTEITLKWSAENGAEHFSQADTPAEFKRGDWIYEFYNNSTERQLGVHLAPGFTPTRALLLKDGWPAAASLPDRAVFPFVRRWDGYATLIRTGNSWTVKSVAGVLQGKDRGRVFEAPAPAAVPTHGNFSYDAPEVTLYLSGLKLALTLDGRKFVVGDYWLATVREDAEVAARVQLASTTPSGIVHHYMLLGRATGPAVQPLSDADLRRLSFPRLTDLTADRVGYAASGQVARWTDVIDEPAVAAPLNVQRALDLLVERLESSDLAYQVPACGTAATPTVRSLLNVTSGSQKLDAVLGRLLCDLKATHLPIDKADPALAPLFNVPAVASVQQGLNLLGNAFARLGHEATVGQGGQFATLADAFTALAGATDISLCLLPGAPQTLPSGATLTGKRSIRLTGVGAYSSRITLGGLLRLGAQEVVLRDLSMTAQSGGSILLQADRVVAQNSAFVRSSPFTSQVWSKRAGAVSTDNGQAVAIDAGGNVLMTGFFAGTINFGGTDLVSTTGLEDVFLVKFSPTGAHLWSKRFTGSGIERGMSLAVDSAGNVFVTGYFGGTINFGTPQDLVSLGQDDVFVAKLDAAAGAHLWSKRFGATARDQGMCIAVDVDNNIVLTGTFAGFVSFGGLDLISAGIGGVTDVFIAKLDGVAGAHLWSKSFTSAGSDFVSGLAVDPSKNVYVAGSFTGGLTVGPGITLNSQGARDGFLVKLNSAGTFVWAKQLAGEAGTLVLNPAVATDAAGNALLSGFFFGSVTVGGERLLSGPDFAALLAKIDAAGEHKWSKRFIGIGAGASCEASAVTADAANNVVLTGSARGMVNFGGSDLVTAGGNGSVYIAKFDSAGNHVWSRTTTGTGSSRGLGLAVEATTGNVALTGAFSGTISFGSTNLVSAGGNEDIFLVKLAPEPAFNPLVTVRPRDAARGLDLSWSQNDVLVVAADGTAPAEYRVALALASHTVGGSIVGNTIAGRVLLSSDLTTDLAEPVALGSNTGIGGGAYLTIAGNDIARINTRYETQAGVGPKALRTLVLSGNTLIEGNNTVLAESIVLGTNQFITRTAQDQIGFAAARQMSASGNQATHNTATLRVALTSLLDFGNLMVVTRVSTPALQPVPANPWYFGGVGADLV